MRRLLALLLVLVPSVALAAAPRLAVTWGTVPANVTVDVLIDHIPVAYMTDPVTGQRLVCPTSPPTNATCLVVSLSSYVPGSSHTVTVRAVDSTTGLKSVESNSLQAMVPLPAATPSNTPRPTNTPRPPDAPTLIQVTPF